MTGKIKADANARVQPPNDEGRDTNFIHSLKLW